MDRPDAAAVKAALPRFDWSGHGFADNAELEPVVDAAVAYVESVTWRTLDATMPAGLAPIALRASALRTAQDIVLSEDDYIGTINDDSIQSFSIGPYSETRRDNSTLRGGRSPAVERLNPWPQLERLLWLLLSLVPGESNPRVEERRDYWRWLASGIPAPASQLQEVDWTNGLSGHGTYAGWGLHEPTVDAPDYPFTP
jgi:hypothetical protein